MKKTFRILLIILAISCLFSFASCNKEPAESPESKEITIKVTIIDDKGESEAFNITTKKTNLADALLEAKLVSGTQDQYGLYIITANGVTADYSVDGSWWSISKGGVDLMTGASSTPIADGDEFELTYKK